MSADPRDPPPVRRALVVVRNAVDHDSRVLRVGRTLEQLGFDTTILGVVSFTERRRASSHGGVSIARIGPASRIAWAIYERVSVLRPARTGGDPLAATDPGASRASAALAAGRSVGRRVLRFGTTLAYYVRAIRFVRALRPGILHCNDYNTMWIGVAGRLLLGSVVIYDSHELWPDRNMRPEPRWWLMLCEALFVRTADRVITTSPAYAEVMARRYRIPEPVVVRNIPDAWPPSGGRPPVSRREPDDAPLVVYVGGLQPNRGLEPAIRALAKLERVRIRLLGPGLPAYRTQLEQLVVAEGVADRVEFATPVTPAEVVGALSGADAGLALIQPANLSYRLTLPNKLFEYTMAGVPILGSDMPMIAQFIEEHGVGVAVDPDDVDAVAAGLRTLLEPSLNAKCRDAASRAAGQLDAGKELELLEAVYREAIGSRRQA